MPVLSLWQLTDLKQVKRGREKGQYFTSINDHDNWIADDDYSDRVYQWLNGSPA